MALEETVTFNLELNVEQTLSEIRKLESTLIRALRLAQRLGLPENINAQIAQIQRLLMTIRLLHSAYLAFQAALGPLGWAWAAISGINALMTTGDFILSLGD